MVFGFLSKFGKDPSDDNIMKKYSDQSDVIVNELKKRGD